MTNQISRALRLSLVAWSFFLFVGASLTKDPGAAAGAELRRGTVVVP